MRSEELLLLDTHVWANSQLAPHRLRESTRHLLNEAAGRDRIRVSVISIWELAMLVRDGKLELDGGVSLWTRTALARPGIALVPFSPEIAITSVHLPKPMHKDPSDRTIVATAIVAGLTLVTADKAVIAFAKATDLAYIKA